MRTNLDWNRLARHLETDDRPEIDLGYQELEAILGGPLPPSAHAKHDRQFWSNTRTHSYANSWLDAGRRTKFDRAQKRVTFVAEHNGCGRGPAGDGEEVLLRLSDLNGAAVRLLQDVADERGGDLGSAAAALLNQAALRRRREALDWFATNTSHSPTSSAELIRGDRDAR